MLPSEKIQKTLEDLPASYQAEVLSFLEYLKTKADRDAFCQECRDRSNLSLYSAMREIEHEESSVNIPFNHGEEGKKPLEGCRRILEDALSLPADARMVLIEQLLASLNLPIQAEIDRLWGEEAERRVAQIAKGEVELVSGEEVFSKICERYHR